MDVSLPQLLTLIGDQTVEIYMLKVQLAQAQAELAKNNVVVGPVNNGDDKKADG